MEIHLENKRLELDNMIRNLEDKDVEKILMLINEREK